MKKQGYVMKSIDLRSLVSRLDRDWDSRISYEEFKEIFYLTLDNEKEKVNSLTQKYEYENNDNEEPISDLNKIQTNVNINRTYQQNNQSKSNERFNNHMYNNNSQDEDKSDELKKTFMSNFNSSNVNKNSPAKENYSNNIPNNNFASTMSTIKGYLSPFRESALEDINIRASLNTYSPHRGGNQSDYVFNQSQTQPRTNQEASYSSNNQFSRKLNYDYNSKNTAALIRSVDRLNRGTSSHLNRHYTSNHRSNNMNNTSLNYSLTNLNNSKEEFFNQNYRSKIKSISPKKYLELNNTYSFPRKNNYNITEHTQDKRELNTSINKNNKNNLSANTNHTSDNINNNNSKSSEIAPFIAKFFQDLIINDTNIEALKESLSLKTDVKLHNIFTCFDLSGKGLICVPDFKETLNNSLETFSSIEDIKLLFKKYDQDLDCKLK